MFPPKGAHGCVKTASLTAPSVFNSGDALKNRIWSEPREVTKSSLADIFIIRLCACDRDIVSQSFQLVQVDLTGFLATNNLRTLTLPFFNPRKKTMPLPDERPRQSVANLIGRFEKQKAASSTPNAPTIPRTSSVTSHRTGDSALEETKEKREWPPTVAADTAPPVVSPTPDPGKPATADTTSASPTPIEYIIEPVPPVEITPPTPLVPTHPTPVFDQSVSMSPKPKQGTTTNTNKSATAAKTIHTKDKVGSDHAPATPRASIVKSTAKPAPSKTAATPTKFNGTAASATSTSAKTPAKPSGTTRTLASKPPSTPNRAKSPSEAGRRTPLSVTRPKTPSHLYAPTAASLARSRANAPPPPTIEKPKRKLTTDLMKPTTASASKMRSPVATASVSRSPKPAVTKSNVKPSTLVSKTAVIKATVKPPSRPSTATATQSSSVALTSSEVVNAAEISSVTTADGSDDVDKGSVKSQTEHDDDEVREQPSKGEEEIENYDDDFADGSRDPPSVVHEPEQESPVDEKSSESQASIQFFVLTQEPESEEHVSETVEVTSNIDENHSDVAGEPQEVESVTVEAAAESETKPSNDAGAELEAIVNMLETAPKVERPSFEAVAGEIPDEHQ